MKHDEYGQVTNKVDHLNGNVFIYGYDANGRLTGRWSPGKYSTFYGYDFVGNLTSVNYTTSPDLALKYDSLNRLTNLVTTGVLTNNYTYTAWGALASEDGP